MDKAGSASRLVALTALTTILATAAVGATRDRSAPKDTPVATLQARPFCGTTLTDPLACSGKLPPNWFKSTPERHVKLFTELLDKFEQASADSFGVRGGVAENTAPIADKKRRWKVVEAVRDANDVNFERLAYPVVVSVIRFFRGDDESAQSTLGATTRAAFLVLYPDGWNTADEPLDPTPNDGLAPFRIVKLVQKPGELAYKVEISQGNRFVEYCRSIPGDSTSEGHARELISQANFLTCPGASISPMTEASFYRLTRSEVRARLRADGSTTWEKLRLREIWIRDSTLRWPVGQVSPATMSTFLGNFIPWDGDEGLWFTCGLGCCYAKM